ncbi:Translation initiation factor 3 subunit b [Tilletia horrida]|nr:Translation initiation factor 3 subunit b [Tilletia horrida]
MAPDLANGSAAADDELDIDYSDIEAKYTIKFDEGLDDVIVLDNVPVIIKSKEAKLFSAIQKRFASHAGLTIDPANIHMPYNDGPEEEAESKGYAFVEMRSADDAATAIRAMNGFAFDKRHTFAVNRFTDVERLAVLDEQWSEPEVADFKAKEHLRSWLADAAGRDQLVMCRGEDVQVAWNNRNASQEIIHSKSRWTESYVQWSPLGTYLATFHRQGVQLWGGPSWQSIVRFGHSGVRLLDFSPCENYLVTWSHDPIVVPENAPIGPDKFAPADDGNRIAIWEVKTGHLLRTFPVEQDDGSGPAAAGASGGAARGFSWPYLKWSGDDKYFARLVPDVQISVYETPSMALLEKKHIKIEGVVDFEWCPLSDRDRDAAAEVAAAKDPAAAAKAAKKVRENMLVYWVPEVQNQPARVTVMSVPGREILRSKNLFSVLHCKLHWHPQGDYLCVKVDRHTKTKKSVFSNLELFRMREKDFPVEVIELKDPVTAFAWEPQGSHFALVSSNDPNLANAAPGQSIKTQLSFFHMDPKKGDFRLLKTLDNKTCNTIFWSPKGRHLIVGTLGSSQKFDLEWYDVDYNAEQRQGGAPSADPAEDVKLIGSGEHYGITDLEWDPSGRYVITSASAWRHAMENGYAVWDFRGNELTKQIIERFKQILWRPRPRTLLTKEQQREVRRNLREIGKAFDEQDAVEESNLALAHKELYQRMLEEWKAWRARSRADLAEKAKELGREDALALPAKELEQAATEEVQEWIEEVLEETEEILD